MRRLALFLAVFAAPLAPALAQTVWTIDNTTAIGGHAVSALDVLPTPATQDGLNVLQFNGEETAAGQALMVPANPIDGLSVWTVELYFYPASGGQNEQRYFHISPAFNNNNRMLFELRSVGAEWYLDTFERRTTGPANVVNGVTMAEPTHLHPHDQWYHIAATYDGASLRSYVNMTQDLATSVTLMPPLTGGQTSLGARQDPRSFFKGSLAWLKVTPSVLTNDQFTTPGSPAPVSVSWIEISKLAQMTAPEAAALVSAKSAHSEFK